MKIEVEPHVARFVSAVRARGVEVRAPGALDVGPEVRPERFEAGAVLHAGTRLRGERTLVRAGASVGAEAPVTLEDAMLGRRVRVRGGSVREAVLLEGAALGSGAHVREGTLLEEYSRGAHCVGLKQTVLMPFATLGSMVNFCDCLLAGGSGRHDHSEVGSGFVHFNYAPRGPRGDKATPSLFGDVPGGALLLGARIFLGGNGGVVGPVELGYGTVLGAGGTYRRDCPSGVLRIGEPVACGDRDFEPLVYGTVGRKWRLNVRYVGNLCALKAFYRHVRLPGVTPDDLLERALIEGALEQIEAGVAERLRRIEEFGSALERSLSRTKDEAARLSQEETIAAVARFLEVMTKPEHKARIDAAGESTRRRFLTAWEETRAAGGHLARVGALSSYGREQGREWLQAVVNTCR